MNAKIEQMSKSNIRGSALPSSISRRLRLPVIAAPMFLVSGPDMIIASCRAGIIGAFPANNARNVEELKTCLDLISTGVRAEDAPWAMCVLAHRSYTRKAEELELLQQYQPPIVITALGSPAGIVQVVHDYGGLVFADVNSLTLARKAAAAGVDGMVLVSAGAGGHTGQIAGFAFVPAVREFFDGIIILAGAISDGMAVRAARVLGADLAYVGTRLIASCESRAVTGYKQMLLDANAEDIVCSDALTGVPANWLKPSLIAAGLDPAQPAHKASIDFGSPEQAEAKRWRDVWSAGHGVGAVKKIEPIGSIIETMIAEYEGATL